MNLAGFDGLWWLLLLLGPLFLLQRKLHYELQGLLLILTRRADISLILFSVLFLPGVVLHEGSHYLMARLLGVRTGRISLLPQAVRGGKLRLGYVETASVDFVRDALIGAAPLLVGGLVTAYIGIVRLGLLPLGRDLLGGQPGLFFQALALLPAQTDFWLWFYLVFVTSSMMMPSAADRRAWLPVLLSAAALAGLALSTLALVAGGGPWLAETFVPALNQALRGAAAVVAISAAVHAVVLAPLWVGRLLLTRVTGMDLA